jgi:hypothetical protein
MSDTPTQTVTDVAGAGAIEKSITARELVIADGDTLRQLLPAPGCARVGPFVSFEHVRLEATPQCSGVRLNVNAGLEAASINYGFRPEELQSGAIEAVGVEAHRIQCWVAIPAETNHESLGFEKLDSADLPIISVADTAVRVVLGAALGQESPLLRNCPATFLHCAIPAGAEFKPPGVSREYAVYVVSGKVTIDGRSYTAGAMAVAAPGWPVVITAQSRSAVIVFGGTAPRNSRGSPKWVW